MTRPENLPVNLNLKWTAAAGPPADLGSRSESAGPGAGASPADTVPPSMAARGRARHFVRFGSPQWHVNPVRVSLGSNLMRPVASAGPFTGKFGSADSSESSESGYPKNCPVFPGHTALASPRARPSQGHPCPSQVTGARSGPGPGTVREIL